MAIIDADMTKGSIGTLVLVLRPELAATHVYLIQRLYQNAAHTSECPKWFSLTELALCG